ncbi:hypothetical protein HKX48_000807 [Thoreauomyces humboldtii]|nr:hypothetical protein HKX48_000807 [Thoreauomyces humboldtii]
MASVKDEWRGVAMDYAAHVPPMATHSDHHHQEQHQTQSAPVFRQQPMRDMRGKEWLVPLPSLGPPLPRQHLKDHLQVLPFLQPQQQHAQLPPHRHSQSQQQQHRTFFPAGQHGGTLQSRVPAPGQHYAMMQQHLQQSRQKALEAPPAMSPGNTFPQESVLGLSSESGPSPTPPYASVSQPPHFVSASLQGRVPTGFAPYPHPRHQRHHSASPNHVPSPFHAWRPGHLPLSQQQQQQQHHQQQRQQQQHRALPMIASLQHNPGNLLAGNPQSGQPAAITIPMARPLMTGAAEAAAQFPHLDPLSYSDLSTPGDESPATSYQRGRRTSLWSATSVMDANAGKIWICHEEGCGKSFKRAEHLNRHNRMHTGERPFTCNEHGCDRRFSRSDNLSAHKKTHEKQRSRAAQSQNLLDSLDSETDDLSSVHMRCAIHQM